MNTVNVFTALQSCVQCVLNTVTSVKQPYKDVFLLAINCSSPISKIQFRYIVDTES